MTDMPKAGFLCAGRTPLALSGSVYCAHQMMDILKEYGFSPGACHTEITEPFSAAVTERAKNTLEHICLCCELAVTVGCDGFAVSDIMPDITELLCNKGVPYFGAMLCGSGRLPENNKAGAALSQKRIPPSRATAGIYGHTLVLNFPSDVSYAPALLSSLIPAIGFTVYNLSGKSAGNCAEFRNFLNNSLDFHEVFKKVCIVNT